MPYDEPNADIDAVFTVILARSLGWGAVYFNAYGETTNGIEFEDMELGTLVGYKASFTSSFFLVVDILLQTDSLLTIEMSPVHELPLGLSIGPGIGAEWDLRNGTSHINAGLELEYSRD